MRVSVCIFCLSASIYLRNCTPDLHQAHIVFAWFFVDNLQNLVHLGLLWNWSSFGGVGVPVLNGAMSIPLQRVTSLRCRRHANAPAASYWLRRILDDDRRRD